MTLYLEYEGVEETMLANVLGTDPKALAERVFEVVDTLYQIPYESQVNLLLTNDAQIQEINKETRGKDAVTDVLSFPMINYDKAADFSGLEEQMRLDFDPDSGELLFGDIVLSIPKMLAQAKEFGHSAKREYAFLLAHSFLHLLGYDHIEEKERQEMETQQCIIMQHLNILRTS